jgi:hypothetical protein
VSFLLMGSPDVFVVSRGDSDTSRVTIPRLRVLFVWSQHSLVEAARRLPERVSVWI